MKTIYNFFAKNLHRVYFVLDLFVSTFITWSFSLWVKFWLCKSKRLALVPIENMKFLIRTNSFFTQLTDVGMVFETIYHNQYGKCPINPYDTVIDIGAHIGSFSIYASKAAHCGHVYAYEPFDSTYNILKRNIALNKRSNITSCKLAVSNQKGERDFYVSDINLAENSLHHIYGRKTIVKTTTLKDIFTEHNISHCNVLKLDCEGSEYEILFSSGSILESVDRIIMEYHVPEYFGLKGVHTLRSLILFLKLHGYAVKQSKSTYYQGIIYATRLKT